MTTKLKASTYLDILAELEKGATQAARDARLIAFLRNTAAEVRAVVEAAWREDEGLGETRTRRALDALDAKAREVSGK